MPKMRATGNLDKLDPTRRAELVASLEAVLNLGE
jgi:hypothetical protein